MKTADRVVWDGLDLAAVQMLACDLRDQGAPAILRWLPDGRLTLRLGPGRVDTLWPGDTLTREDDELYMVTGR